MITVLLQSVPPPPTEGASSRIHAILDHLRQADPGLRVVVVDPHPRPGRGRLGRLAASLARMPALALRTLSGSNRIVLLSAPALPFFETPSRIDLFLAGAFLRLLALGARRAGSVLVLNLHDVRSLQLPDFGVEITEPALEIFRKIENRSFAACRYILAPGGDWPAFIREHWGIAPERLVDFPNGCVRLPEGDGAAADLPGELRFVYAGTMTPRGRGLEAAVAAFREVRSPRASLILLGPGGEWCREAAGGDPRVHYLGPRPVEECIGILRSCHVALYPYPDLFYFAMTHTTSKMALYMTCGLPVLATRSRAVTRFVEEEGVGVACEAGELAGTMNQLAEEPGRLEAMRANARRVSGSYYWDVIIDAAFAEIASREGLEPLPSRTGRPVPGPDRVRAV